MGAPLTQEKKAGQETSLGLIVDRVRSSSPAAAGGIRPGDRILRINCEPAHDMLDFYTAAFAEALTLQVDREGETVNVAFERARGEDIGIEICPERPYVCGNKCVFCFVDQMPRDLRKSLYVKDEDYRLSFLHGNYLTLTNIEARDEERILRMHLSPLYVSVHATDPEARARLLGRRPPEPLLDILDRLARAGIRFHTQVVLVPGYNDGVVLEQTLDDLCRREDHIRSVSVVPVGLTSHRERLPQIEPVGRDLAAETLALIDRVHTRMRRRAGRGIVYAGDELFLLAGTHIPKASYYDDYPQIDNGVGLIRTLLESSRGVTIPGNLAGKRLIFVTGMLAAPYIEKIAGPLRLAGVEVDVLAVENRLFGPSVTVSGLLSGRDIIDGLGTMERAELAVFPPNLMNADGITLDGRSAEEMAASAGMPIAVAGYDFKETVERINNVCKAQ